MDNKKLTFYADYDGKLEAVRTRRSFHIGHLYNLGLILGYSRNEWRRLAAMGWEGERFILHFQPWDGVLPEVKC